MPISIAIEPTTFCNLRCPECPSGLRAFSRSTGRLDSSLFQSIIDQISNHLVYLTLYFQGEPYLNREFLDMVSYASKRNIYTATSTNAHFLDERNARKTVESGLDRLIISIDGLTQTTYQIYRVGGKLNKVIQNTKKVISWKRKLNSSKPYIIFQFLVIKSNEHEVPKVYQLAKALGVDAVALKTAQIYDYKNGSPLIPLRESYSRYKKNKDGTYNIKNKFRNGCWKMWHACVITWDGKVVPCCFDKDAHYRLGDLRKKSFRDTWKSRAYQDFRQNLLTNRKNLSICQNCTEGTKIWT